MATIFFDVLEGDPNCATGFAGPINYIWVSGYPFTYCNTLNCGISPWETLCPFTPDPHMTAGFQCLCIQNCGNGGLVDRPCMKSQQYACEVISQ